MWIYIDNMDLTTLVKKRHILMRTALLYIYIYNFRPRCGRKLWTLYIFYWIKVFLKFPFAVSFSVLFITIQYAVFRKSFRTFYVSFYIYIYMQQCLEKCSLC